MEIALILDDANKVFHFLCVLLFEISLQQPQLCKLLVLRQPQLLVDFPQRTCLLVQAIHNLLVLRKQFFTRFT